MRFIGDVHGDITTYLEKIKDTKSSFQVGDMGLGFRGETLPELDKQHVFIRGNHDDPNVCKCHPNYAGDYGYWCTSKLFYLGGAYSIDALMRRHHEMQTGKKIWWPDEELSLDELDRAYSLYCITRPKVVVTHDGPDTASNYLLAKIIIGYSEKKKILTRTGRTLERMFQYHQPDTWIFGHYHYDQDWFMHGTRFICLGGLSYIDFTYL